MDYPLSSLTVMQIMELRARRGYALACRFNHYIQTKIERLQYPQGSHPRFNDPDYVHDNQKECLCSGNTSERDKITDIKPCIICGLKIQVIGTHVALRMQEEPSWTALLSEVKDMIPKKCSSCQRRLLADLPIEIYQSEEEEYGYGWNDDSRLFNELQTFALSLESQPIAMKSLAPSTSTGNKSIL
jgi:hypothetical protein